MAFPVAHVAPPEALEFAAPLSPPPTSRVRTPAEEARTLVAGSALATLSTLSEDGSPWGSLVGYGQLGDGSPVLFVSTLAEHGRNLHADARTSLVVTEPTDRSDPLDAGRVTLAGRVSVPSGDAAAAARAAFLEAVPEGRHYADFGDFSCYVLGVERVRWVGGYGRMDSCSAEEYRAAEPDPVGPASRGATAHMNADHADALLAMARTLAGFPDATEASCRRFDRYGLDLWVRTPRGAGPGRVAFTEPCAEPGDLRPAAVEATRRARAAAADGQPAVRLGATGPPSSVPAGTSAGTGATDLHGRYALCMSTLQIRSVPDDVRHILKERAARAGQSLSEYMLAELTRSARQPTFEELTQRIGYRGSAQVDTPAADILRAERERA